MRPEVKLWQAISIVGIWIGTGLSAFGAGQGVSGVAFCAFLATLFVLMRGD